MDSHRKELRTWDTVLPGLARSCWTELLLSSLNVFSASFLTVLPGLEKLVELRILGQTTSQQFGMHGQRRHSPRHTLLAPFGSAHNRPDCRSQRVGPQVPAFVFAPAQSHRAVLQRGACQGAQGPSTERGTVTHCCERSAIAADSRAVWLLLQALLDAEWMKKPRTNGNFDHVAGRPFDARLERPNKCVPSHQQAAPKRRRARCVIFLLFLLENDC